MSEKIEFPTPSSPDAFDDARKQLRDKPEAFDSLKEESKKFGDKTFDGWRKLRREVKDEREFNEKVEKTKQAILDIRQKRKDFLIEKDDTKHTPNQRRLAQAIRDADIKKLDEREKSLSTDPLAYEVATILIHRDELNNDGFVWTDHHLKEYEWLASSIKESGGRPILEYGPSGTGKTELVRAFAKDFVGEDPIEVRGNEQTRMSEFVGEMGLRASNGTGIEDLLQKWNEAKKLALKSEEKDKNKAFEQALLLVGQTIGVTTETYKTLGKIGEALEQAKRCGRSVLLIDEYNRIPADVVGGGLKGFFKELRKAGVVIIATANLKDDKHKGVRELEPQEKREFTEHTFDYIPKSDLERLCLASVTEEDDLVRIGRGDKTIERFAEAITKCQQGYTGRLEDELGQSDAQQKGERTIHQTIVEQGRFISWLLSFNTQNTDSIYIHLSKKIKEYLESLPEGTIKEKEDKKVIAHIFAQQGFDIGSKILTTYTEQIKKIKEKDKNPRTLQNLKDVLDIKPEETEEERQARLERERILREAKGGNLEQIGDLDISEIIQAQESFFGKHGIDVGPHFESGAKEIWQRNFEEIEREIQIMGYDGLLIMPGWLDPETLHTKMTEGYGASYLGENFKNIGGFKSIRAIDKMQIVLYHKTKEFCDNQISSLTRDKNVEELYEGLLTPEQIKSRILTEQDLGRFKLRDAVGKEYFSEGLSLQAYMIIQRMYFERTGEHMDSLRWTWVSKTTMVLNGKPLVSCVVWNPSYSGLDVRADSPGLAFSGVGCRLSRCFE